jgi:hypothetical protein
MLHMAEVPDVKKYIWGDPSAKITLRRFDYAFPSSKFGNI